MTWTIVSEIQTTADWLLTESISGSLFRITHNVSGSNIQSLRSVIAQAFDEGVNNTYFDFRRLSFKPEQEAFYFPQPGGLFNRKLAIKRLDNLTDSWTITIEVLNGMPTSFSLPITQAEVIGLEEELQGKAAVESLNIHVADPNPHTGSEPIGAGAAAAEEIINIHLFDADPHPQYASDTQISELQTDLNSKASSGINNSITSLTGLTTPLSISQGGTGNQTQNFVDLSNSQTIPGLKSYSAGQIVLNNTTSNLINFGTAGLAAPALTTRSLGTKILFYPQLFGSNTDYAMGLEIQALWTSIPTNTATHSIKWYGGTTEVMKLTGLGNLSVLGSGTFNSLKIFTLNTAPATASAVGSIGSIAITTDAIYVCVATNQWKKTLLTTW